MDIRVSKVEITRFPRQSNLMGVARVVLNECLVLEGIKLCDLGNSKSRIEWPKGSENTVGTFVHSKMLFRQIHSCIWKAYWGVLC